jgi:lysophospholipase L1-like esterase
MHLAAKALLPLDVNLAPFEFHPLLQGTPEPNFTRFSPFFSRSSPFKITHDSYGLRGDERDKELLKQQIVIATVGGSTNYDVGVGDEQTWSSVLERKLGSQYAVLNHGVPAYSTVENLIQTLFYLDSYDVRPRCAIYYEGWNDIRNAHLPHLDPAYADNHLLAKFDALQVQPPALRLGKISPVGQIVVRYLQSWSEIIPTPEDVSRMPFQQGSDPRLEKYFRANLEAIAAVNEKRGITSIFVGQVLNRAQLTDNTSYGWLPLVRDKDVWPLQARFNTVLKETADALGSPSFIPPIEEFRDSDFVDNGHFSAEGSEKFATMLLPLVRANCTSNQRAGIDQGSQLTPLADVPHKETKTSHSLSNHRRQSDRLSLSDRF